MNMKQLSAQARKDRLTALQKILDRPSGGPKESLQPTTKESFRKTAVNWKAKRKAAIADIVPST